MEEAPNGFRLLEVGQREPELVDGINLRVLFKRKNSGDERQWSDADASYVYTETNQYLVAIPIGPAKQVEW